MKRKKLKMWATALAIAGLGSSAWAIPVLQLDVLGGTYVGGTEETTFARSNPFTLRALIDPSLAGRTFYLSAAIVPQQTATQTTFGSFAIDGTVYNANGVGSGMHFGVPPVDDFLKNLPGHAIYPTWYAERSFLAGSSTVGSYNVQDGSSAPGLLKYVDFNIDISGLLGYVDNGNGTFTSTFRGVHFDLYSYDNVGNKIDYFAPFSHDAQSGGNGVTVTPPPPPSSVPDGGMTVLLLGSAIAGLGVLRRKLG